MASSQEKLSNMRFFCGSSHPELGQSIASKLGVEVGQMELSQFSCGELFANIQESIRGFEVYILQTCGPQVNRDLMELFIIMDALKRCSAAHIHVIMPHFGYARQDKKAGPREPITSRLVADLLDAVGLDRVLTMDLHAGQIQGFFSVPVDHLTAMPLFINYFQTKHLPNLVVVAPDAGRAKFAKKMSDRLGGDLAFMHKTRPGHNKAEITHVVGDVKDKTVLLIDDMVDTGGSVTNGIQMLRDQGCKEDIYLATTHGVFSGPAFDRLSAAGFKEVVVTDTIPIPEEKRFPGLHILSVADMFAEAIRRNHTRESISSLYEC